MAKQHIRRGWFGKQVRIRRANDTTKEPLQWWDQATKQWLRG